MSRLVYLDYNATTPVDPRALEAMLPWFSSEYGNASSRHGYGRAARQALDTAREQVAAAVGARPAQIVFTSGGSEANNLFLKGANAGTRLSPRGANPPPVVAVSGIEHPGALNAARQLCGQGWKLLCLPVDTAGKVTEAGVLAAARENPERWSVMLANNETGVLQDVARLARLAGETPERPGWFHCDAVQAFGKIPLNFQELNAAGVHALTISAHKIYGPKGAAALVIDKRLDITPLIAGGGQENGARSGTENIAAIVGFGRAAELAAEHVTSARARLLALRERLEQGLSALGATLFGADAARLPNTSFFAFAGIDGETLVGRMDEAGFAIASGSACASASAEPSHVLLAMGVAEPLARGAARVSLGEATTGEEIDRFLAALAQTVSDLRRLTALRR
ncbi:MAG: cysteine desulfurase [Zoogloeaceae bacterium]|jgi:cysteine desulfurase|nr:cysteine desulfurase [Zoogloeaceae bacterium]